MKPGDFIVLIDAYRRVYASQYHIGLVLYECASDTYYFARRWVILWTNSEVTTVAEDILHDTWVTQERSK